MILLSHGYFIAEDEKEQVIMKPYVPLGILYLSAYLEERGVQHEVYDSTFSSIAAFHKMLLEKKPSVLALYTNLMTKINVLKIVSLLKSEPSLQHCKIVLGGPEIRYNALNYLNAGADLLVIGEGEATFYEICIHYQHNSTLPQTINGTAFLHSGEISFAPERALVKDINSLPMPARHRIDLSLYGDAWKNRHGYSMYSVSTMRGCPYTCKWCSRAVYGGTYRRRSPALVAEELQLLKDRYAPDRIWFVDDVFTISHKWLKEFTEELERRSLRIPYEIITRADRMNEEVIALLKKSGCFRVWIGAESGSQEIIEAMDRRVDVKMVRDMIIKAKTAGIEAGTFIMLGYPGETKKHIKETIEHLAASDPTFYTITVAYPITGTPLYHEVSHTLKPAAEWSRRTDRELDFERGHSRRYYQHAVDWVNHELRYRKSSSPRRRIRHKLGAIFAQARMLLNN